MPMLLPTADGDDAAAAAADNDRWRMLLPLKMMGVASFDDNDDNDDTVYEWR